MEKDRISAIVLAAGRGRRMGGDVPKQYLELCGKPLICHTLSVFEESAVDEVILVTAAEDVSFCQTELVEKYGFSKVRAIVAGGAERYDSVWQGLQQVRGEFVLIHDGARAFVTAELIDRGIAAAKGDMPNEIY